MAFISQYECSHRTAFEHYLRFKGYTFSNDGPALSASSPYGQSLEARFRTNDQILEVQAIVTGPVYPPGV